MRRPSVYERSAPRRKRQPGGPPPGTPTPPETAAGSIAAELGPLIEAAEAAGLAGVAAHLRRARAELGERTEGGDKDDAG